MKNGSILIIDDEKQILTSLKILLDGEFSNVQTLVDPSGIPDLFTDQVFDVVMLDMNFKAGDASGEEGLYWLKAILRLDPQAVIIMITAYGDIELAVRAIKMGAFDFISKPWDPEKLIINLKNGVNYRRSKTELNDLKEKQRQLFQDLDSGYKIVTGPSRSMQEVLQTVRKVAATDANVMILGENGTGKELIARDIHRNSPRAGNVFIPVDVAALSETLFESEMFGHLKGSFTDAKEDRAGRFELAHNGTLFLDEIGNLPVSLQAKLLSAIQKKEIMRVGSSIPIPVDIRLITATNKPILEMIKENTFREDLYYRLNTIVIDLPPLRERVEDIPYLAEAFLKEFGRKYDKGNLKFTRETMDKLCSYQWPGNVRELRHSIEKAVILCENHYIRPGDLQLITTAKSRDEDHESFRLEDIEKNAISRVMRECRGNLSKAAKILDISRTTLYAKINKYGI
ncbi:MAG: sigma-54-dependent transcriptional regulator [Bacteroidales bacterium]